MEDDFSDDIDTEGRVEVGGSIRGVISPRVGTQPGDEDWFRVSLNADVRYRIELRGGGEDINTLGSGFFTVLDSEANSLNVLASPFESDPDWLASTDFMPSASEDYFISVFPAVLNDGSYTLSVTEIEDDFPDTAGGPAVLAQDGSITAEIDFGGDVDLIGFDAVAGELYSLEMRGAATGDGTLFNPWIRRITDEAGAPVTGGDGGTSLNSRVLFEAPRTGTFFVEALGRDQAETGTYTLTQSRINDDFSAAPDTAGRVDVGSTAAGRIDYLRLGSVAGDIDWFKVSLEAGKLYSFQRDQFIGEAGNASARGISLSLMDGEGRQLSTSLGASSLAVVEETGDYFVQISGSSFAATEGAYQFSVNLLGDLTIYENFVPDGFLASGSSGSPLNEAIVYRVPGETGLFRGRAGNDVLVGSSGDDVMVGDDFETDVLNPFLGAKIYRAYNLLLNRAPDATGYQSLLEEDYVSPIGLARKILFSPEFAENHGELGNAEFVDLLYTMLRGVSPPEDNVYRQNLIAKLDTSRPDIARSEVAAIFFDSEEFRNQLGGRDLDFALERLAEIPSSQTVFDAYVAILDRAPDLDGFLNWQARLSTGLDTTGLAEQFLGSAEFALRSPVDDEDFLAQIADRLGGGDGLDLGRLAVLLESGALSRAELVAVAITLEDGAGMEAWSRAQGTDDLLIGGGGADRLYGGVLSDHFVFAPGGTATSTIHDFEPWDTLDLSAFEFADRDEALAAFSQNEEHLEFAAQDTSVRILNFDLAGLGEEALLI